MREAIRKVSLQRSHSSKDPEEVRDLAKRCQRQHVPGGDKGTSKGPEVAMCWACFGGGMSKGEAMSQRENGAESAQLLALTETLVLTLSDNGVGRCSCAEK